MKKGLNEIIMKKKHRNPTLMPRNIESMSPYDMCAISDAKKTDTVMKKPREMIADMVARDTDPNGSYTGVPVNKNEKPVQDADDL
ncbi:MAG: hypothetical protein FWE74_04495 [Oscillospiraceae bacterium]|nr:hypothetical protein [Oscillospiraceae bacterium]